VTFAMRDVLLLSHRIPYPPDKGDKIRSWHLLQRLLRCYRIHLGCLIDDEADYAHVPMLRQLCESSHFARIGSFGTRCQMARALVTGNPLTLAHFYRMSLGQWVAALHRDYNISAQVIYCSAMAQYVEAIPNFRGKRIIDFVDVDSDKWAQYARSRPWPLSWIYGREARLLADAERRIAKNADCSLFASENEANYFRSRNADLTAVRSMPNGVDTAYFDPSLKYDNLYGGVGNDPILVFVGRMDYWANVDAMLWFTREVLPLVRESAPGVRLFIVGAAPTRAVRALGRLGNVIVTGRVPDVRPYLAHATLVVAPLRIARGIQNKALEAMAMAKAVIATPQVLEGIEAKSGENIVVAESGRDFADAVILLLRDWQARLRVGAQARVTVVGNYDWNRRLAVLDRLLEPTEFARHRVVIG